MPLLTLPVTKAEINNAAVYGSPLRSPLALFRVLLLFGILLSPACHREKTPQLNETRSSVAVSDKRPFEGVQIPELDPSDSNLSDSGKRMLLSMLHPANQDSEHLAIAKAIRVAWPQVISVFDDKAMNELFVRRDNIGPFLLVLNARIELGIKNARIRRQYIDDHDKVDPATLSWLYGPGRDTPEGRRFAQEEEEKLKEDISLKVWIEGLQDVQNDLATISAPFKAEMLDRTRGVSNEEWIRTHPWLYNGSSSK